MQTGVYPSSAALPAQEKLLEAHQRLQNLYTQQELISRRDPMRELISTVLSHRTTHADEEKAYWKMLEKFGNWERIRFAPYDELVACVASSRYPEIKARYIQGILQKIYEQRGDYTIDFLADMPTNEAMQWLMSLPGVGLKTASLVLLFNFKKPVLPVDTHVYRVTQRLGVIGLKVSADKAHELLLDMLPKDPVVLFNVHKHFFWHGQKVCKWASPICARCPLTDICNWFSQHYAPMQLVV